MCCLFVTGVIKIQGGLSRALLCQFTTNNLDRFISDQFIPINIDDNCFYKLNGLCPYEVKLLVTLVVQEEGQIVLQCNNGLELTHEKADTQALHMMLLLDHILLLNIPFEVAKYFTNKNKNKRGRIKCSTVQEQKMTLHDKNKIIPWKSRAIKIMEAQLDKLRL